LHPHSHVLRFWNQVRARPRLVIAMVVGAAVWAVRPAVAPHTNALLSWVAGGGLYLALAWIMMARASTEHMRWRARIQDDGAAVVLLLTVLAALASLAAIVLELSGIKELPGPRQTAHVVLVGITFATSWLVVHTAFALHYAHAYYVSVGRDGAAPLVFPAQESPVYVDFLYFAMVVGMTSQTADVAIASTPMRRLAMSHGIVAFIFNTTLLALTVNIAAGLIN
jgi:uncharacterized membrane protein